MTHKRSFVWSAGGVVAVLLILVAVNYLLGRVATRADLTDGKVYTLSEGTRAVLSRLDAPVRVRFYWSREEAGVPVPIKAFARRVEDLLGEFRSASGGRLTIEKLDPQPDSDAEDSAALDGVDAQQLPSGDRFYLGLAIGQADQKVALPALGLDRERLLEYDLTRAIVRASATTKPTIGVMSPMPVFGSPGMPMMGMPPSEKWVLVSELERDYTLKRVAPDATTIDPALKVLLLLHPRGISEATQYAIDQFVLGGGRLVAFLDSHAYFDRMPGPMQQGGTTSSLDTLLKAWGLTFDATKVVSDLVYVSGAGPRAMPGVLTLDATALNADDVSTQNLGRLLVPFAGTFGGTPAEGLTQTVLMRSSKRAALVDAFDSTGQGERALRSLKPSGTEYPIAVKLTGRFRSAFPDGAPKPAKDAEGADPARPAAAPAAPAAHLAQAKTDGAVVLVGDVDMVNDAVAVQIGEVFGQRVVVPANGNLAFAQAVVDQFAGDADLVGLRTRAVATRPFTVIREMEARAASEYLGKIKELEDDLQQTQEKLQALQKSRGPAAGAILSAEQQAELEAFRKRAAETRLELKNVRRDLRADSEALQFRTKLANIVLVPALVALAGIAFAVVRRRRTVVL